MRHSLPLWMFLVGGLTAYGDEPAPLWFDIDARGGGPNAAPRVEPWHRVPLDAQYAGAWVVAGDLTGDGVAEIVSARNVDHRDVHYTSAVAAQRLDGTVLWRWGDPQIGRRQLHHDVACQIHDLTGDGRPEVVLATRDPAGQDLLVVLQGATGKELRRWPIPSEATDCLVFANLSGTRANDLLVKTRYSQLWAYSAEGTLLWSAHMPGGYRTAHQPVPIDLTGNGVDEIMAGYALLNADGTVRWVLESEHVDIGRGHLDCCRVVRQGDRPEDWRLVVTYCGANGIAMLDGNGRILREVAGRHFESVHVGRVGPAEDSLQVVVDIAHHPAGEGPLWVLGESGELLGRILTEYSRHHTLIDWTGEGLCEIVVGDGVFDHRGRRVATLALPDGQTPWIIMAGDIDGNGVPDLMLTTREMGAVYVYENRQGSRPRGWLGGARGGTFVYGPVGGERQDLRPVPVGTGTNFTLY